MYWARLYGSPKTHSLYSAGDPRMSGFPRPFAMIRSPWTNSPSTLNPPIVPIVTQWGADSPGNRWIVPELPTSMATIHSARVA